MAINESIKSAEFSNLLAELNIDLSQARVECAALAEENAALKRRIRELEGTQGEQCPKCRRYTWVLEKSEPDRIFGAVGGSRRTYKCSACGFSESGLTK
jgi:hypothetical protein